MAQNTCAIALLLLCAVQLIAGERDHSQPVDGHRDIHPLLHHRGDNSIAETDAMRKADGSLRFPFTMLGIGSKCSNGRAKNKEVAECASIGINPRVLRRGGLSALGDDFDLPLSEAGNIRSFHRKYDAEEREDGFQWTGELDDYGQISITVRNGVLVGFLSSVEGTYKLQGSVEDDAKIDVQKIDTSKLPNPACRPVPGDVAAGHHEHMASSQQHNASHVHSTRTAQPQILGGGVNLDVLVVYTPQAVSYAGGLAALQALIQSSVDYANAAFQNSGMSTRHTLKAILAANYADSGSIENDLTWLQREMAGQDANGDGTTVKAMRDANCADLVALITGPSSQACGIGYVMPAGAGSNFANYAASVTGLDCLPETYAHETGHNLGCAHDFKYSSFAGADPYAFGWKYCDSGSRFTTIMSYGCDNGAYASRAPYFSNPNVNYMGRPTGIWNAASCTPTCGSSGCTAAPCAFCAQTIDNYSPVAANFRSAATCGPSAPAAPTGVSASSNLYDKIRLTWNASPGATQYSVYRNTAAVLPSAGQSPIATVTTTQYDDTSATVGVTYHYVVTASSSAGTSGYSAIDSGVRTSPPVAPPVATAPAPPTGLSATTNLQDRVRVSWTASSGATQYEVSRNTIESQSGATLLTSSDAGSPFDDTSAVAGAEYFYYVKAKSSAGTSAAAGPAEGMRATPPPVAAPPAAPTGVSATNNLPDQIQVSWSASTGATSYQIFRKTASSPAPSASESPIATDSSSPYSDTSATPGVTYYYWVKAVSAAGTSLLSSWDSGARTTASPPTGGLATPTAFVATAFIGRIRLTWLAVSGATSYEIYRSTSTSAPSASSSPTFTSTTNTRDDTSGSAGVTYYFWVRAKSSSAVSLWSNAASARRTLAVRFHSLDANSAEEQGDFVLTAPDSSLTLVEGNSMTFYICLRTPPTTTVTVNIEPDTSGQRQELSVNVSSIMFTSANYSTATAVTVSAVNGGIVGLESHPTMVIYNTAPAASSAAAVELQFTVINGNRVSANNEFVEFIDSVGNKASPIDVLTDKNKCIEQRLKFSRSPNGKAVISAYASSAHVVVSPKVQHITAASFSTQSFVSFMVCAAKEANELASQMSMITYTIASDDDATFRHTTTRVVEYSEGENHHQYRRTSGCSGAYIALIVCSVVLPVAGVIVAIAVWLRKRNMQALPQYQPVQELVKVVVDV